MERNTLHKEFILAGLAICAAAILVLVPLLMYINTPLDEDQIQAATVKVINLDEPEKAKTPPPAAPVSPPPYVPPVAATPAIPDTPPQGILLKGRVVTKDKEPVVGATLSFRVRGRHFGPEYSQVDGTFEFTLPENGQLKVEATHQDYSKVEVTRSRIPNTPIEITMEPGGSLSGRVVDMTTGQPIVGAAVRVGSGTGSGTDRRNLDRGARTDANGEWSLPGLPPGHYSVAASAKGYAVGSGGSLDVLTGLVTEKIEMMLEKEATINGTVIDDSTGFPITGATISFQPAYPAGPRRARTGSDGTFSLKGVNSGSSTIQVNARGYLSRRVSGLRTDPGRTLDQVEVRLQKPHQR